LFIVIFVRLPFVACGQVMSSGGESTWATAVLFWKMITTFFALKTWLVTITV